MTVEEGARWTRLEQESAQFSAVLNAFEVYNESVMQAYIHGSSLASKLSAFYPDTHPYRGFVDAFVACQETMKAVAHDLLRESFTTRIQEPLRSRQLKLEKLHHMEELREKLWKRYSRHLERFNQMRERDHAKWEAQELKLSEEAGRPAKTGPSIVGLLRMGPSRKTTKKDPPLEEDTVKLKLVVEDELKLHEQMATYLESSWSALETNGTAFLDPAIAAATALQSQTANLQCELLSEVVQRSPDSMETREQLNGLTRDVFALEEALETRLTLILSSPTSDQAGLHDSMDSISSLEDADEDDGSLDTLGDPISWGRGKLVGQAIPTSSGQSADEKRTVATKLETSPVDIDQYDSQDDGLVLDRTNTNGDSLEVEEAVVEVQLSPRRETESAGPRDDLSSVAAQVEFIMVDDSDMDSTDEEEASSRFFGDRQISMANSLATVDMSGHHPAPEPCASLEFRQPTVIMRMKALFPFTPSCELELGFSKDDIIEILLVNPDGWWEARDFQGNAGLVPFNLLVAHQPHH